MLDDSDISKRMPDQLVFKEKISKMSKQEKEDLLCDYRDELDLMD